MPGKIKDKNEKWQEWNEHLSAFQARRKERRNHPNCLIYRFTSHSRLFECFADFCNIQEGVVLDVGCGSGGLRKRLDLERIDYFGLDRAPTEAANDFRFVQSLAEVLPFRDGTFTDVTVTSALDHFVEPEAFFREVQRVLKPTGLLHISQSIHELTSVSEIVKLLTHEVKDFIEVRRTTHNNRKPPKHLHELSRQSLCEMLAPHFEIVKQEKFSERWYIPSKMFLSLAIRKGPQEL